MATEQLVELAVKCNRVSPGSKYQISFLQAHSTTKQYTNVSPIQSEQRADRSHHQICGSRLQHLRSRATTGALPVGGDLSQAMLRRTAPPQSPCQRHQMSSSRRASGRVGTRAPPPDGPRRAPPSLGSRPPLVASASPPRSARPDQAPLLVVALFRVVEEVLLLQLLGDEDLLLGSRVHRRLRRPVHPNPEP